MVSSQTFQSAESINNYQKHNQREIVNTSSTLQWKRLYKSNCSIFFIKGKVVSQNYGGYMVKWQDSTERYIKLWDKFCSMADSTEL